MVIQKIKQIWHTKDIRNDILFVLLVFIIFRTLAHIPVPGVDVTGLQAFFNSNQVLGLLNILTGGGLENFSVVMLGVGPYITSSIIFQLLGMIIPKLEEMQKESEQGRQKINQWTRLATVPLAFIQSYGTISFLQRAGGTGGADLIGNIPALQMAITMMIVTAGTVFLMWLGELMSERRVGNGVSLLIFAGIVSGLPTVLLRVFSTYDSSQLINVILFLIIAVVTVAGVVFITEGQRNIPVQYARQVRGNRTFGGSSTHLPLRVNMAGVIPIIFAVSVVLFPSMIAQFLIHARTPWIANLAQDTIALFNNQLFYGIVYFILVFAFTYFYTEVVFHPDRIAENLQKQGGFIPGIRPGQNTSDYLSHTAHRIILVGALFLGLVAVLPLVMRYLTGIQALAVGGTSLLIVVSVVIETVKQIEAQLTMREYDGL